MYNYVVTAHKSSAVSHCQAGCFLGPDVRNLLVAKSNRIEVFNIANEGILPKLEFPIYGKIEVMKLFRVPGDNQDQLFVMTSRYKVMVLRWDSRKEKCVTVTSGDMKDRIGSNRESQYFGVIDPLVRCHAVHLNNHSVKIIPGDYKKDPFLVRITESIHDIQFLHGYPDKPVFAILYHDSDSNCHLKTMEVSLRDKGLVEGPVAQRNLESTARRLIAIPEPYCGVIVMGETTITYFSNQGTFKSVALPRAAMIEGVAFVDANGSRILFGDQAGRLYILVLKSGMDHVVSDLVIEQLGVTSLAKTIAYLDNGFVFIGSALGDSQLVKLHTTSFMDGSYLEEIDRYPNVGPILDFAVVDLERQGQGQIVTCSGAWKDGSLRVIRNGISITEMASVEMPAVKDMFALKRHFHDRYHAYLVMSFSAETRIMELLHNDETGDEELAEGQFPGLDAESPTIFASNVVGDMIVQVTPSSIRLLDCESKMIVGEPWTPPEGTRVPVASGNPRQILAATTDKTLLYFEIDAEAQALVLKGQVTLENEVSSLSIAPLGVENDFATVAAVGMWKEITVRLIEIPSLALILKEPLGGETIARSVLLCTLEGTDYLLVGIGDGHLCSYRLNKDNGAKGLLTERRKISIGTQPPSLKAFRNRDANHVFAACDRPTVIHAASGGSKLLCSNVNQRLVDRVCGFDAESFPDCLALASPDTFKVGAVDDIQKLHIRTYPLGRSPHRIAHLAESQTFGVIVSETAEVRGDLVDRYSVILLSDSTFDVLHEVPLETDEWAQAILSMKQGDGPEHLVIGTSYIVPGEEEPKKGRVLVFTVENEKLVSIAEREVPGAVHDFASFNGKVLVAVNSKVHLLKWAEAEDGSKTLSEVCNMHGFIIAYRVQSRGDFITVGDLVKSITLCVYKQVDNTIEEIARDYNGVWVTSLEMMDNDNYLAADNMSNLYTLHRNTETADDAHGLERTGDFHLGEYVNWFRPGSLVMQMPDSESPTLHTVIYGSVSGSIGVVARLRPELFKFFEELQTAMNEVVVGIGNLNHSEWRTFSGETMGELPRNFIDGDLIERFLDLEAADREKVAARVKVSVDELTKKVEEMSRIH